MAHPAKFSKALIERIYDHLLERGYIQRGDAVGDPFGGVGTGALIAAYRGLFHISVELEPRFFDLAHENLARHADKLRALGCPHPLFIQGDSRKFHELVTEALSAIVSSPPYAGISPEKSGKGVNIEKQWETYRESGGGMSLEKFRAQQLRHSEGYGESSGQIGHLKSGSVDAVITSPPFTQGYQSGGGINKKGYGPEGADKVGDRTYQARGGDRSPENVERLKEGTALDAIATSPPYLGGGHHPDQTGAWNTNGRGQGGGKELAGYGDTEGQIGKTDKETYWQAVYQIYQSCFLSLRVGGVIGIVVKDYCSGGKRVKLCDDTATLLEHCGFVIVERIHAMLVSEERHDDFFDGETVKKKERKSFFRRLYEAKVPEGDERRIDFEEVIIARKTA